MSELIREQSRDIERNPSPQREVPFKIRAEQFIDSVPENGRLFDYDEMRSQTLRDSSYRSISDSLAILLRAYGQLDKQQQEAIVSRIQTIINGAHLVSEKMAAEIVPDILKLAEAHIPKNDRPSGVWRAPDFGKRKMN